MKKNLKHKFVVASPMVVDPVFAGSVVFILEHNKQGAVGIILNSKQKIGEMSITGFLEAPEGEFTSLKEAIEGGLKSVPLYLGGPCRTPGPMFLHGYHQFLTMATGEEPPEFDLGIPNSFDSDSFDTGNTYDDKIPDFEKLLTIMDGVYYGSPFTIAGIIDDGKYDEGKFRCFIGASSWSPGQLEKEISNGAWTVRDADPEIFFDQDELNKIARSAKSHIQPFGDAEPELPEKKESMFNSFFPKMPPGFKPEWN